MTEDNNISKRMSLQLKKEYSVQLNEENNLKNLILNEETDTPKRYRSLSLIIELPKNFVPQLKPQISNVCPSPIRLGNENFNLRFEEDIPKNTILHVFNIHNIEEENSESYNEELAFSECDDEKSISDEEENEDEVVNEINQETLNKMRKSFKVIRKRANTVTKLNNDDYHIKNQIKDLQMLQEYSDLIPKINTENKVNKINNILDKNNKVRKEHRFMTMENPFHKHSILGGRDEETIIPVAGALHGTEPEHGRNGRGQPVCRRKRNGRRSVADRNGRSVSGICQKC